MATAAKTIDWLDVAKNLGMVVLGSIIGKIAGSALGRISGIAGIGTTGVGFVVLDKMENKLIGYFVVGAGAGMIASPIMEVAPSSVKGLEGFGAFAEDFKAGAKQSTRNLAAKFYLDKTPLAKYLPDAMAGFGDVEVPTEEQAQKIINEMIEENKRKQLKGSDEENLNGNLLDDYRLNGSIMDDYMGAPDDDFGDIGDDEIGDLAEVDEMGRLRWKDLSPEQRALKLKNRALRKRKKRRTLGELEEILSGNDLRADYL